MNIRLESVVDGRIMRRTEQVNVEDIFDFVTANTEKYSIHELLFSNVRKIHFDIEFEKVAPTVL